MVSLIWRLVFLTLTASTSVHSIQWVKHEVANISEVSDDKKSLDYSVNSGHYFEGNYDTHFREAMRELDRLMIPENEMIIDHIKGYVVKYGDDRSQTLNMVWFRGLYVWRKGFYLMKEDEEIFHAYTVKDDVSQATNIHWTRKEVSGIISYPFDETPLDSNRAHGYHFNHKMEMLARFLDGVQRLQLKIELDQPINVDFVKKYTVKYEDDRTEQLNLVRCNAGISLRETFYMQKLADDEFCIYTTPRHDETLMISRIRWSHVEVASVLLDPSDDNRPLPNNRRNGFHFDANYGTHFTGAMQKLGRPIINILKEREINIQPLNKYIIKHNNGRTEKVNLVKCHLIGAIDAHSLYLRKLGEGSFCVYTVIGDDDDSTVARRLASMRWLIEEVASVVSDPADDAPLTFGARNGRYFEGKYQIHFIGAMKELRRLIKVEQAFVIGRLKKYKVKYDDGRKKYFNLVRFDGGGSAGNRFYLKETAENSYTIYTVACDYDLAMSPRLCDIRWTKQQAESIYSDSSDDVPLDYCRRNGQYFVANYNVHFTGAMEHLGRPIIPEHAFMIGRIKKYTVEYMGGLKEKLNLVHFTGGGDVGNSFYLQEEGRNKYRVYTLRADDERWIAQSRDRIYWTKKVVSSVIQADDEPLSDDLDTTYDVHFTGAMNVLGRPMDIGNAFAFHRTRKHTVKYKDGRTEELNLEECNGGGAKPGNIFYLQKLEEDRYCIYALLAHYDEKFLSEKLASIRWTENEVSGVYFDSDDDVPLDCSERNGYDFIGNYDIHFTGAMRELGREVMEENPFRIYGLRKYTVEYDDGLLQDLNLVRFEGGGQIGNEFYLQKLTEEDDFHIFYVQSTSKSVFAHLPDEDDYVIVDPKKKIMIDEATRRLNLQ